MLLMIRINLIGTSKGRKRRAGMPDIPNVGALLFVLLLVVEGAVLYSWHAGAEEKSRNVSQKLSRYKHELDSLKKTSEQLDAVRKEIKELKKNTWLFDELTADKVGPVNALTYLSWILQERDEATHPTEELKQMEAAGWSVGWRANRAWFTSIRENKGEVTISGHAIDHSDVAEVLRRLESSAHFREVRLMFQEVQTVEMVDKKYVEFTIKASLIFLVQEVKSAAVLAAEKAAAAAEAAKPGRAVAAPSASAPPVDRPAVAEAGLAEPGAEGAPADASLLPEAATAETPATTHKPGSLPIGRPSLDDLQEAR